MKVKDLIEVLSKSDPELKVLLYVGDDREYAEKAVKAGVKDMVNDGMGLMPFYPEADNEWIEEEKEEGEDPGPYPYLLIDSDDFNN